VNDHGGRGRERTPMTAQKKEKIRDVLPVEE